MAIPPEVQRPSGSQKPLGGTIGFWAAAAVAAAALAALFAWPTVDAGYRYARWLAEVDLGLETIIPSDPAADQAGITAKMLQVANQWDLLGRRVAFLYLLCSAACAAMVAMAVFAARQKSKTRIAAVIGILLCWIALWCTRSQGRGLIRSAARIRSSAASRDRGSRACGAWADKKRPRAPRPEVCRRRHAASE